MVKMSEHHRIVEAFRCTLGDIPISNNSILCMKISPYRLLLKCVMSCLFSPFKYVYIKSGLVTP